jgi:diguanylate cyclase (GGDEF)-like protein
LVLAYSTVIYAALLPGTLRTELRYVVLLAFGYLVVTFGTEAISRWLTGGFYRWLFWLALGVDGAFLAGATYLSGGSADPERYLVLVYLAVITLLGTWQTGVATAVWQTVAQSALYLAQREGALAGFGSSSARRLESERLWAFLAALWVLTLAVAYLAAVNQRDLSRRRRVLDRLIDLGQHLEDIEDPAAIGDMLLDALSDSFGLERMVLFHVEQGIPRVLSTRYVDIPEDSPLPEESSVVIHAVNTGGTIRAARIDPAADPMLAALYPATRNLIVVPLIAQGVIGVLVAPLGRWAGSQSEERVVLAVERFAGRAALALRGREVFAQVRQMAITDGLTQLYNRRAFDRALDREIARAARADGRLSLVLVDLDHFKAINDEHGHVTGDTVLRQISRALQASVRSYDVLARYGGEEFAAVLPGCSGSLALRLADRLRLAVAEAGSEVTVTASVGVATYPYDGADAGRLLLAADRALYASKRAGRNQVRTAGQARVEQPDDNGA